MASPSLFPQDEHEILNESGFDDFWEKYPRKEAKKDAEKAWRQGKIAPPTAQLILAALHWQCQQRNWQDSRRYIPLPASYLRGERWNDERRDDVTPETAERIKNRLSPWEQAKKSGLI